MNKNHFLSLVLTSPVDMATTHTLVKMRELLVFGVTPFKVDQNKKSQNHSID